MAARQPARRSKRASTSSGNAKSAARNKNANRDRSLPIAAAAGVIGAVLAGLGYALRRRSAKPTGSGNHTGAATTSAAPSAPRKADGSFGSGEHPPVDLTGENSGGNGRAPEAFRPDPTAPIPEGERDAFRPALQKPSLVEPDRAAESRADTAGGSTLSPQGGRVTSAEEPAGDNISADSAATPRTPGIGNL